MELVDVTVKMPKESYELAKGLGAFAVAVKKAVEDGWQLGTDLPVIATAALMELLPAIQGVEKIGDEAKADPVGIGVALIEGLRPVFKKD